MEQFALRAPQPRGRQVRVRGEVRARFCAGSRHQAIDDGLVRARRRAEHSCPPDPFSWVQGAGAAACRLFDNLTVGIMAVVRSRAAWTTRSPGGLTRLASYPWCSSWFGPVCESATIEANCRRHKSFPRLNVNVLGRRRPARERTQFRGEVNHGRHGRHGREVKRERRGGERTTKDTKDTKGKWSQEGGVCDRTREGNGVNSGGRGPRI